MKKLLAMISLMLVACMATGCAYLPSLLSGDMLTTGSSVTSSTTNAVDGDTVTISREEYERYQQFDVLLELMDLTNAYYYEEVDVQSMLDGAANGLLQGLGDPYTFYYTPEEFAALWEDDEGEYAGVGIQISTSYLTGLCTVSRVFDNGPAREAGIHKGDILYMVEDMYVNSSTINDAVDVMRGVPGTDVNVTVLRGTEELTFTLTRATITVNRIESGMLNDKVGYIIMYEFAGDASVEFSRHLQALEAQGMQGLIIDLRDNPGGWVTDAEEIADLFLDKGTLCYLQYKDGSREYYRTKTDKADRLGFPLVILVNENSASSSEILTGALMDRAGATVVGVQSYGKGIVQSVVTLDDGAGMQMTVAQYYTPNGNAVHKLGITPHVEVHLPEGDNGMYEFGDLNDPQLAKALEVMMEKLNK
ncbi:MAG: S41 family peptidase [Clostridia bacterium]|nr:S41 family peptidase [Clostridia bacterium]